MEGAYKDCPEGDLVRVYEGMDFKLRKNQAEKKFFEESAGIQR